MKINCTQHYFPLKLSTRCIVRELLACAVMRPVLNLANPRFNNERIESFVISKTEANKGAIATHEASPSKNGTGISSDHFSRFLGPTTTGIELIHKKNPTKSTHNAEDINRTFLSKDPLLWTRDAPIQGILCLQSPKMVMIKVFCDPALEVSGEKC